MKKRISAILFAVLIVAGMSVAVYAYPHDTLPPAPVPTYYSGTVQF